MLLLEGLDHGEGALVTLRIAPPVVADGAVLGEGCAPGMAAASAARPIPPRTVLRVTVILVSSLFGPEPPFRGLCAPAGLLSLPHSPQLCQM
ncbi:hypothetical protein V6L77_05725 [Pannonibacter sp. Pt2-lr]